ncbi:Ferrichrome-iron receptor precursor [compost metagenome]
MYDAAVHYDLSRLNSALAGVSVDVTAKNLLDKDYISTCDGFWCYYGDERSVIAGVNYKW